jgi:hypothetical protein
LEEVPEGRRRRMLEQEKELDKETERNTEYPYRK